MRQQRLRHISININPIEAGLQPYCVTFLREASRPVPSLLADGLWYTHPEHADQAIVWAQDEAGIAAVLRYHYGDTWRQLRVHPDVL